MDDATYAVEAAVEQTHWWFVGRRELFGREIARLTLAPSARVADIGTGTGAGLRMLRDIGFSDVRGVDMSEAAIRYCALKNLGEVQRGDACALPFPDASYDLICATDVIEHVDDDARALAEISRVLRHGGYALLTVPTFASLWGLQDEKAHHKRRYRLAPLLAQVRSAGMVPVRFYYFNYLLFAPIWMARQIIRIAAVRLDSENEVNTPAINRLLTAIFRFDCLTAPHLRLPFGVSALIVARKS
jgi:SAM-dependent methyltransferase